MTTIQSESSSFGKTLRQVTKLLIANFLLSIIFGLALPTKLLRLLPVISSIVSLQFTYDEYFFLSCWTKRVYRAQANELLPRWFANWQPTGTRVAFGSFTLSSAGGMANATTIWNASGDWIPILSYLTGASFAAGHLIIFGPREINLFASIRRIGCDAPSTESLERWLKMHTTRSFAVDLPATLCFIIGLLNAISCVL